MLRQCPVNIAGRSQRTGPQGLLRQSKAPVYEEHRGREAEQYAHAGEAGSTMGMLGMAGERSAPEGYPFGPIPARQEGLGEITSAGGTVATLELLSAAHDLGGLWGGLWASGPPRQLATMRDHQMVERGASPPRRGQVCQKILPGTRYREAPHREGGGRLEWKWPGTGPDGKEQRTTESEHIMTRHGHRGSKPSSKSSYRHLRGGETVFLHYVTARHWGGGRQPLATPT